MKTVPEIQHFTISLHFHWSIEETEGAPEEKKIQKDMNLAPVVL